MTDLPKQQSNSFSTGGGGVNFETRIQAAFTVLMLTGRIAPCIQPFPITKLKLQGRYAGYNTDDFIAFCTQPHTNYEARLFAQIKHEISITAGDKTFSEVISSAWSDFIGANFNSETDAFALITGLLNATDIRGVRPVLEWARQSQDEKEFLAKLNTAKFSSDEKRTKVDAVRSHLRTANNGEDISDKQLWQFLKAFHLIGYDLDIESGSTLSLIQSLISLYSNENAGLLWSRILDAVQTANQNAGTITLETLPADIRNGFNQAISSRWASDVNRLKMHGSYILDGIRNSIGGVHIPQSDSVAQLIDLTELARFILISGERGSGKSGLVRDFLLTVGDKVPVFCLRTEDLDKPHLDNVFSAIGLTHTLVDIEAGFALMTSKFLVIESLEKLLELNHIHGFTDLLHLLQRQHGWTVIATCRDYAYQTIAFNHLQPSGVKFETLLLSGFSDVQVQTVCSQLKPLQSFAGKENLRPLLNSPFFADLAYRVLQAGAEFTSDDGEEEFRAAVWRDVIAKEQIRINGMPLRRKQAFTDIAVKRARSMVYGIPQIDFDAEAVSRLEEDNLVRRDSNKNLISPAHDVLEDWAIDKFIEDAYLTHHGNIALFLNTVGHEPAMGRTFRLWLQQKLRNDKHISQFVYDIFKDQNIQRHWQDETIAAVLQGDYPNKYFEVLEEQLFRENGKLFKRFCFILRIACQTPDQTIAVALEGGDTKQHINPLFLKPYGNGWEALIHFALKNKHLLPVTLTPHITAVLNEWASALRVDKPLLPPARTAGLLALHLLNDLKDSYRDEGDRKKLISVILKTASAIQGEFEQLLKTDVFIDKSSRREQRLYYVDELCKMALTGLESEFLCKYHPDILISLAESEWFIEEKGEEHEPWYDIHNDVAECFGMHGHRHDFSPPSGLRGPFRGLFYYHSRKGLDFIIKLLNTSADKYAHSNLESPSPTAHLVVGYSDPQIEQVEIQLNDGTCIQQYFSGRLWSAYRGHSVVPYLLQSALMALENWLIAWAELEGSNRIEWLFDYILRNSNSVMPTAVLASIANGFFKKLGKSSLPLLRTAELFLADTDRAIHERVGGESNWFGIGRSETLSELYAEERRTAALRSWRKENLESLIIRLQFSEWRDDALKVIDTMRGTAPNSNLMRFFFNRIDSRGWKPIVDETNNRITFESKSLEPDLDKIQQETQEQARLLNRCTALYLWANNTFERKPLEKEYYASWSAALVEAKELYEELAGSEIIASVMYYGGIVTAAAVFVRDHNNELNEEDIKWCANLIVPTVLANADSIDSSSSADATDLDGAAAAASVLSIFLDFAFQDDEILMVKMWLATALTHVNEHTRYQAAIGVREYLWQRDPSYAQVCLNSAITHAKIEKESSPQRRRLHVLEKEVREAAKAELIAQRTEFRDQFALSLVSTESNSITLESHSAWHILTPCLMIPIGSRQSEHITLMSQMLTLFFKAEQDERKSHHDRDEKFTLDYKIPMNFSKLFAKHLFHVHDTKFIAYVEQLRLGCDQAPGFMKYLVLCVAVEAENQDRKEVYWQLWEVLTAKVQAIAVEDAKKNNTYRVQDDREDLIRGMMKLDIDWQKIDFENQDIMLGKNLLLEFASKAGKNPIVFEALAKLIYYFPSIFFEVGINILAKHQKEVSGNRLLTGINTAFYLERSIQRFLLLEQTGPLPKGMHESCHTLLDAVVETASARAYYLREQLIRSRRII